MTLTLLENGAAPRTGFASVADSLVGITSAVVVGESTPGTALAAIATARVIAQSRIVTIVDLIGNIAPLRALAEDDDPHGVSDCFVYGISPKAVTRRTHASDQLFVIPAGTEPIEHEPVLSSARWGRLIGEYRNAGALLLFVAVARSAGLSELIAQTEGVVAVGAVEALLPSGTHVLVNATPPLRRVVTRRLDEQTMQGQRIGRRIAAVLATAAAIAIAAWVGVAKPFRPAPVALAAVRADTVTTSASAQLAPSPGATAAPVADARAEYAVLVATGPTYAAALRTLRDTAAVLGARTISPLDSTHFAVLAGAYGDSSTAGAGAAAAGGGAVVARVPLALRLADSLAVDSAQALARRLLARGIPAYVLRGTSGNAAVYAGAFATSADAGSLTTSLRRAGLSPVLTARTGRP